MYKLPQGAQIREVKKLLNLNIKLILKVYVQNLDAKVYKLKSAFIKIQYL